MDASSMEKHSRFGIVLLATTLFFSCQSAPLKYQETSVQKKSAEFDQVLKIEKAPESIQPVIVSDVPSTESPQKTLSDDKSKENEKSGHLTAQNTKNQSEQKAKKENLKIKNSSKDKNSKQQIPAKAIEVAPVIQPHLPAIEDGTGFNGRRPLVDPFRVGEEVKLRIHYMGMTAGEMRLKVENFATVNSRKSYAFASELSTLSVFEKFYKMNDRAVTYVDFDTLLPYGYSLDVKESGQLRTARQVFDYANKKAKFWEVKVTEKDGQKEKKVDWELPDYAQNVFTAVFYMRLFRWEVGKSYSFLVAHDGENLVFKGTALRKETIETDLGPKQAVVVKPELTLKGVFKPMGDIYFWFSDDDRKYVLKIEAKIKIGSLSADVSSIYPGQ